MTVIVSAAPNLLARIGARPTTYSAPPAASTFSIRQGPAAELPTRVTLGQSANSSAVYSDPRATSGVVHVWSSPVGTDDTVSGLMARNRGMNSYTLSDNWRGLGGALLTRFGKTGEDYTQTLVDEPASAADDAQGAVTPAEQAQRAADILARQTSELAGVAAHASTADLKIQTRSGQSLELKISVNASAPGMKVELKASGAMSATDRAAIGKLADGLNRALEGLGRDDAVGLDLSGLMNYDHQAIASVDLTANTGQSHQVLDSFSLHLGDDKQSIALKGSDGDLKLNVDTKTPRGNAPAQQRRAAVARTIDRIDSAGERSHAQAALIQQMKSAFEQMQAAAATDDDPGKDAVSAAGAPVDADVASQLSGLADFDATFGGQTHRSNRDGASNEAGYADYQLSQKTTTKDTGSGGRSVAQTVSEKLSADFQRAAGDSMLDVSTGNYSTTRVRDSSTVTTLIDATADRVTRVLRKTDEQQLKTVTDFQSHHVTQSQSWPSQGSFTERLH